MSALLDKLKELDIAALLPDMSTFLGQVTFWLRLMLLIGPLVMVGIGLCHFFFPPEEANHAIGFRTRRSMSSLEAWRYAQRLSGFVYMVLGGTLFLIMLIISLFFGQLQMVTMVVTALVCVIVECVLALGAFILVECLLWKFFDKDGYRK